jgi:hypothetical protein
LTTVRCKNECRWLRFRVVIACYLYWKMEVWITSRAF